jgi:hypothetical protein
VVSNSVITTTGPFDVSGFTAGVSVEGPMASVSVRLRLVGSAGFDCAGGAIGSARGCVVCVCAGWAVGTCDTGSSVDVASEVAAGSFAESVFISTGLVARAS